MAEQVLRDRYASSVVGDRYVVQNNVWGARTPQELATTDTGFAVAVSGHDNRTDGPPAAYPSIFYGWHYGTGSPHTILPVRADSAQFGRVRTGVRVGWPDSGTFNVSYDLWFDPQPRLDGQNTGAELMIWLHRSGPVQPAGVRVGTASVAGMTWQVWHDDVGWQVVSYVVEGPERDAFGFVVGDFHADALGRGWVRRDWFLTSVQVGFEIWAGGAGLRISDFAVDGC